jgi:hypothetical protein
VFQYPEVPPAEGVQLRLFQYSPGISYAIQDTAVFT